MRFKISKTELARVKLCSELGNGIPFQIGMKVRATFIDPPFWFYGYIVELPAYRYVHVSLEKCAKDLAPLKGRYFCFRVDDGGWVEPYEW